MWAQGGHGDEWIQGAWLFLGRALGAWTFCLVLRGVRPPSADPDVPGSSDLLFSRLSENLPTPEPQLWEGK